METEYLNLESGLELTANDSELYKELLEAYLTENKFDRKELEKLISDGKNADAANYVHRIKGASRQIGAEKVSSILQNIEDILRGKAQGNVEPLLNEFCTSYEITMQRVMDAKNSL